MLAASRLISRHEAAAARSFFLRRGSCSKDESLKPSWITTFFPWREVAEISPPAELHGQISNFSSTTGVVGVLVVSLVGAAFTSEPPSVRVHDEDPEVAKQRSESANASRAAAHARHELFKQLIPGKCTHICHKTMQL